MYTSAHIRLLYPIMRILIIFLLGLISTISLGQNQSNENSEISIKIDPLAFLPPYSGPSARIGIEYKIKENWSLFNEIGYYLPLKNEEYAPKNTNGYTAKIELKHYFAKVNKTSGEYVSAELFYKYHSYDISDSISIYDPPNSRVYYKENYSVSKNVEAFTIKYGEMKVYSFGLVIDYYVGLGIRLKQSKNSLTNEENENIDSSSDYGPNIFTNQAGNFIYPNFSLGIKIGYRIK